MTKAEILLKIEKAKKGLTNSNLTDSQKGDLRKGIEQLEAKLLELTHSNALDKEDPEGSPGFTSTGQTAMSEAAAAGATADEAKEDSKEPVKKDTPKKEKPKAKKKITKENKTEVKSDCDKVEKDFLEYVAAYGAKKKPKASRPKTKKRTSEVLADGFTAVFVRAIRTQLTLDKVSNIKLTKLRDARDKIVDALEAFRIGFGGAISPANESFIEDFKNDVNKIFEEVEEKQKKVEETKQTSSNKQAA